MLLTGISLLGWLHSFACIIAIAAGAYVLCMRKGTRRHRVLGWWYAVAMIVQNLLVMAIYRFDIGFGPHSKPGPHTFGFFHYGAIIALAFVGIALFSARRQRRSLLWRYIHSQSMLVSYYLLFAGFINELFARVLVLRTYAMALSPHASNSINTMLSRQTQLALLVVWLIGAVWFAVKVAGQRKPPAFTIGYPMRFSGGVLVACAGLGILLGGLMGGAALSWGLLAGLVLGIAMARRTKRLIAPLWGLPSLAHGRFVAFAIGSELSVFTIMGASGAFAHMTHALVWESSLAIVGCHFLLMRWSHGSLMLALGAAVLTWLSVSVAMHLSLAITAAGDGLLKLVFGAAMAWPLLKSPLVAEAEHSQASRIQI